MFEFVKTILFVILQTTCLEVTVFISIFSYDTFHEMVQFFEELHEANLLNLQVFQNEIEWEM